VKDSFITGGIMMGLFALLLTLVGSLMYVTESWRCSGRAEIMGVESHYSFQTGCMYKIDGRWIPSRNYREGDEE
jgi:hypothetical protein